MRKGFGGDDRGPRKVLLNGAATNAVPGEVNKLIELQGSATGW
jgi:hypothetical protein